ncbi:tautomerase family protein [Flammeovirga sp. SubArs3]|uniref:tautomerase family protein n=1 Tax=Flammeovirga sp. SubArs3 TaxID=2995316 RepID=UPI00248C3AD8|nr:tautomerase family protein [Flammeovirga sp. SubArs3]
MSQIKIYGLRSHLNGKKQQLSDIIHACVVEALQYPQNKRAHRFINLEKDDFYYPEGRTDQYIIIEIMMITGRTVETKKKLIQLLFKEISEKTDISTTDIEILIQESPASNWGFRGMTGDEVSLNYKINV